MDEEKSININNIYSQSEIIKKLINNYICGKPLKIAFIDIDSTLSGHTLVAKKTRAQLEEHGYEIVFVTGRTEELVMSKQAYIASRQLGFSRPRPRIGNHNGKRFYVDPAKSYPSLVDPAIIIGSTGTQVLVKQICGGYQIDKLFQFDINPKKWRKAVLKIIQEIDPRKSFSKLSSIEFPQNYQKRKTNVYPPLYRIDLNFYNLDGKLKFLQEIEKRFPPSLQLTDNSYPEKGIYGISITPIGGFKGGAVNHVVNNICRSLKEKIPYGNIQRADLHVVLAGDSYPDLSMLFHGAFGTNATAIVVGGSRLSKALTHETNHMYAGEDIFSLKCKLKNLDIGEGIYHFITNIFEKKSSFIRKVIVGDYAFPKTKGPETILACLQVNHI